MRQKFYQDLFFLEELVRINSITSNIEGVNQVQNLVAAKLEKLGFSVKFYSSPGGAKLLHAHKAGKIKKAISFIGHADTVFYQEQTTPWEELIKDQEWISATGIGDDKGGLVLALSALETFLNDNPNHHYSLHFVSSPSEETGSLDWHSLFQEIGQESQYVFGLEPAPHNGSLIGARNGNRWYQINIQGRSAHAGRFDEPFVNAAHHAGEFIGKLHSLNDIENKLKVNIGSLSSGHDRYNVTCDQVGLKIDTRFPCFNSRNQLHDKLTSFLIDSQIECYYSKAKCQTSWVIEDDCPPLPQSFSFDVPPKEIQSYLGTVKQIEDRHIRIEHSGGAADINYFYHPQAYFIDGLGPITQFMHTKNERTWLPSLITRSMALSNLLAQINERTIQGDRNVLTA